MEFMMFCFIVEIEYIEIDVESVGVFVSADFFVGFYIHFHANGLVAVHCRSPPVNANLSIRVDWRFFCMNEDKLDDFEDADYYVVIDRKNNIILLEVKATKELTEINQEILEGLRGCDSIKMKQDNEKKRHWEQSETYEITLHIRAVNKPMGVDEIVEKKIMEEKVREAIPLLPEIQKRRIKKYYYGDLTLEQIARQENCSKAAVKYSLDFAIENLKKNIKN